MQEFSFQYAHPKITTWLTFLFSCVLASCSQNGQLMMVNEDETAVLMQDVVGDNLTKLEVNEDGQAVVEFTDYDDEDQFVIVLYNQNSGTSKQAFQIDGSSASGDVGMTAAALKKKPPFKHLSGEEGDDRTEALHLMLRHAESKLNPDAAFKAADTAFLTTAPEVGSQREFKVLSSFSAANSFATITATLRYTDGEFDYYVDNQDADSMSDDEIASLAENYAAVRDEEEMLFGNSSDVDGNGRVEVVFTRTVNGIGLSGGGFVSGFFYAADLFSSDVYPISNESEVVFTFVPDPAGELGYPVSKSFALSNIWPGVIAHEYQHMISFNRHVFEHAGAAETGFLNEALSHLAEDIFSVDTTGYMQQTGIENFARVRSYLGNINNVCFTCGATLEQRGGSYLFMRYLYEQAQAGNLPGAASGAELLALMMDTTLTGQQNIVNAALGEDVTVDGMKELLDHFFVAVYLSGSEAGADSSMTHFTGIDLRATQNDNRGTVLNGPGVEQVSELPYTDTVQGNGSAYVMISGQTLREMGGILTLSFATDSNFGGYVISP